MFARMKIAHKLPALFVLLALITVLIATTMSYLGARATLVAESENKLALALKARADAFRTWLGTIDGDIVIQASSPATVTALQEFSSAWTLLGDGAEGYLQDAYIHSNSNPTGGKHRLDAARDGSRYSAVHAKYRKGKCPEFPTV